MPTDHPDYEDENQPLTQHCRNRGSLRAIVRNEDQVRNDVDAYAEAMGKLSKQYPDP